MQSPSQCSDGRRKGRTCRAGVREFSKWLGKGEKWGGKRNGGKCSSMGCRSLVCVWMLVSGPAAVGGGIVLPHIQPLFPYGLESCMSSCWLAISTQCPPSLHTQYAWNLPFPPTHSASLTPVSRLPLSVLRSVEGCGQAKATEWPWAVASILHWAGPFWEDSRPFWVGKHRWSITITCVSCLAILPEHLRAWYRTHAKLSRLQFWLVTRENSVHKCPP